jgi:hypothetical protein
VVIDPENRTMLVRQNGTIGITAGTHDQASSDDPSLVFHCNETFTETDSTYGATSRCEAVYLQRDWVTTQDWLIDRVTGHLAYNWRMGQVAFAKTAECSPMDTRPKF